MKQQIKNYNKYYWQDGEVYNKATGKKIAKSKYGVCSLKRDDGRQGSISCRKMSRLLNPNYKTYQEIQQQRGVKYKPVYNNPMYMFCEDVEDELKVWSIKNDYFLTPYHQHNHLRYSINSQRIMFYIVVWQYYNQTSLPKKWVVHHIDFNPNNNSILNLSAMTSSCHSRIHKIWKFRWSKNKI